MQFRKLGKSELEIPVVGLGTWAIGGDSFWGGQDRENSVRTLQAGLETGKILIDTAPCYGSGTAEEIVGEAIRGHRDQVVLATKCGLRIDQRMRKLLSRESIMWEVEESLRRLGTDHIDLYQCHWPDLEGTPQEETATALYDLVKQGKVRAIGVSNYSVEQMEEFSKYAPLASLQPQYSLLERTIETAQLPWCREHDVGILSYGSLGAGLLSGKYTAERRPSDRRTGFYSYYQEPKYTKALALVDVLKEIAQERGIPTSHVAIGWVTAQPGVTCALVGARTPAQALENLKAGDVVLTAEELGKIQAAYEKYEA